MGGRPLEGPVVNKAVTAVLLVPVEPGDFNRLVQGQLYGHHVYGSESVLTSLVTYVTLAGN